MTEEKFEEIRKGWQLINEHNRITEENIEKSGYYGV